jgi:hypothetical protein
MKGLYCCLSVLGISIALGAHAQTVNAGNAPAKSPALIIEKDRSAPVDHGFGPNVKPKTATNALRAMAAPLAGAVPAGDANASSQGVFGAPVTWPIIGLHSVLLPDGRVMSYGTNDKGQQGAKLMYDVWDPTQGTDSSAYLTLQNETLTDIFCSGQSILSSTGEVLITGGDLTINGKRNFSIEQTEIFNPQQNTIRPSRLLKRRGVLAPLKRDGVGLRAA